MYNRGLHRKTPHLTLRAFCCGLPKIRADGLNRQNGRPTRIGISISHKVSKRAVVRNRIKRQIRAALRQLLPRLSPGWDLVVIVKPKAVECNSGEFLQELEQLLVQAEVLNGYSGGNTL